MVFPRLDKNSSNQRTREFSEKLSYRSINAFYRSLTLRYDDTSNYKTLRTCVGEEKKNQFHVWTKAAGAQKAAR